jgi:hypothetical protein
MTTDPLTYHLFRDAVVIHYQGDTRLIGKDDPVFEKVLNAISSKKFERIGLIVDNLAAKELKGLLGFLD